MANTAVAPLTSVSLHAISEGETILVTELLEFLASRALKSGLSASLPTDLTNLPLPAPTKLSPPSPPDSPTPLKLAPPKPTPPKPTPPRRRATPLDLGGRSSYQQGPGWLPPPPRLPQIGAISSIPAESPSSEPQVAREALTLNATFEGVPVIALAETGSQANVLSPALAHKIGAPIQRLLAPVRANLNADGHEVCLALFTQSAFASRATSLLSRPYFVAPLPPGIDAILSLPWFKSTGAAASASSVFLQPDGPSEPIVT